MLTHTFTETTNGATYRQREDLQASFPCDSSLKPDRHWVLLRLYIHNTHFTDTIDV